MPDPRPCPFGCGVPAGLIEHGDKPPEVYHESFSCPADGIHDLDAWQQRAPRPAAGEGQVRVRAAAIVNEDGSLWVVQGWSDPGDEQDWIEEGMSSMVGAKKTRAVFIEASLPPAPATVEAEVEEPEP